jgi:hypothetical protein
MLVHAICFQHPMCCVRRYRLLVDESNSFGVLGARGRGAWEHWGLAPGQVEVLCASMGNALASIGGFCVGSEEVRLWVGGAGGGGPFTPHYHNTCACILIPPIAYTLAR